MKVCILGENKSVHVQKWIGAMSNDPSIQVTVISFDRGMKFDKVSYFFLKKYTGTKLDYLLNAMQVRRFLRSKGPDMVHAHYATSHGFLAAYSGVHPLIITGWGSDIFDSPKNFLMRWLVKWVLAKADALTVLSQVTLREIRKLTSKPVQLIPFGVDIKLFKPLEKKREGIIRIGTIRTLAEKYGVEYLIRAFSVLVGKNISNLELHIVGDGPLRSHLENLSKELGVQDKVYFHGYINQNSEFDKYINLLGSWDIFAILSIIDSETFGVAAVEASACGIPVVATNVGGLPEVVTNNETGIIVPPKDEYATFVALERLINDKDFRIKLGGNGRKKVEMLYNWENNVNQMKALYLELIR